MAQWTRNEMYHDLMTKQGLVLIKVINGSDYWEEDPKKMDSIRKAQRANQRNIYSKEAEN